MEVTSYTPGTPNWVDLGTTDIDAAAAFYGELFGWETADMGPDAGGYRMCSLNGKNVAGLGPAQRDDVPPFWTMYVSIENVEETTEKVLAAGGQIIAPVMDVFDAGRMAVFLDNVGAPFSVWQPKEHIGSQLVNEPGSLTWEELLTRDLAAAKAFYPAVFDWELVETPMDDTSYTIVNLPAKPGDDKMVGGMMEMPEEIPAEVPPMWSIYFNVADADATAAKVRELGGEVVREPADIMPGRFAVLKDPQGAMFQILQFPTS